MGVNDKCSGGFRPREGDGGYISSDAMQLRRGGGGINKSIVRLWWK